MFRQRISHRLIETYRHRNSFGAIGYVVGPSHALAMATGRQTQLLLGRAGFDAHRARKQPKRPSKTMRTPIAATHSRPAQYSQNHAYGQEAQTPPFLPRRRPRASRALSASRASSSPNSTGSIPAWPPPCRGRPSGRRGRTRRATMRACGLWPARQWNSSACSCAGATSPL